VARTSGGDVVTPLGHKRGMVGLGHITQNRP